MPELEQETREPLEQTIMPPSAAERTARRVILALAVLLAGGMLTLGVVSWITRGQRATDGPVGSATPSLPTPLVTTATTAAPTPSLVAGTAMPAVAPSATAGMATTAATPVSSTAGPPATKPVSSGATTSPNQAAPGPVTDLDPVREAQRTVVATVGDGKLGDRVAALLDRFYPAVTRAYAEDNAELLRPFLDEDAYEGYQRSISRAFSEAEVSVPVQTYRIQPKVLSNGPGGYAVNVAVVAYDRDIDAKTRQVLRVSRPYRQCERWYLIEVAGEPKIEGGIAIAERYCDAGWPEPPTPTKG